MTRRPRLPWDRPSLEQKLIEALRDLPRAQCPTPQKEPHRTLNCAELASDKQWARDRRILWPYRCGDHYHLTSHKPRRHRNEMEEL